MASYRLLRLASRIKFLVSTVIQREIRDPRMGMVTVLEVELTGDLREAAILVSIFGPPGTRSRTIHALEDARGFIQKEVAKNLETRNTPRLKFILDEGQDKVSRIETLMEEAQEDQEVAMAKKSGKKDDKEQKGIGSKPSKSASRPAKAEKKSPAEKGAEKSSEKSTDKSAGKGIGKGIGKGAEKAPVKTGGAKGRPPRGDGEKRPRRGFDDDDSGPAKDFEVEDLGDEEKDFLEEFAAGEEEPEEDDDEDEDDEEEEEEEEEEPEKDY